MKKTISILIAVSLLLSLLSACGEGEKTPAPSFVSVKDEYVWVTEEKTVSLPSGYEFALFTAVGEDVYIKGNKMSSDGTVKYGEALFRLDSGGALSELTGYTPLYDTGSEVEITDELVDSGRKFGFCEIRAIDGTPDGELLIFEHATPYIYVRSGDGDYAVSYTQEEYHLRWFDTGLNEIQSLDITELLPGGDFYPNTVVAGAGRTAAVTSGMSSELLVFSADGGLVFSDDAGGDIWKTISLGGGGFAVTQADMNSMDSNLLRTADTGTGRFGEGKTIENVSTYYSGAGEYEFFYVLGGVLFGRLLSNSGDDERFMELLSCGVNSDYMDCFVPTGDGAAFALINDYGQKESHRVCFFRRVPASEAPETVTLTLATTDVSSSLRSAVLSFNRQSPSCKIEVLDYGQYNSSDDYGIGTDRLLADIGVGKVPDLIDVSDVSLSSAVSSGLLVDLYGLLDADEAFGRDAILPGVLSSLEYRGGLYGIPASFMIAALVASTDVIGAETDYTLAEMKELLASQPDGMSLFGMYAPTAVLNCLLAVNSGSLVSYDKHKCDFTNEVFYDMLEIASYAEPYDYSTGKIMDKVMEMMSTGRQLFVIDNVSGFSDIQKNALLYGGECSYLGYPTGSGSGFFLRPTGCVLGITSACKDANAAWEFLKFLLRDEGDYQSGFPVTVERYEKLRAEETTADYFEAYPGAEPKEQPKRVIYYSGEIKHTYYGATEEEAALIDGMIAKLSGSMLTSDGNVTSVIFDNVPAYFAGDKSAKETAKLIESSVSIYLNEQK